MARSRNKQVGMESTQTSSPTMSLLERPPDRVQDASQQAGSRLTQRTPTKRLLGLPKKDGVLHASAGARHKNERRRHGPSRHLQQLGVDKEEKRFLGGQAPRKGSSTVCALRSRAFPWCGAQSERTRSTLARQRRQWAERHMGGSQRAQENRTEPDGEQRRRLHRPHRHTANWGAVECLCA